MKYLSILVAKTFSFAFILASCDSSYPRNDNSGKSEFGQTDTSIDTPESSDINGDWELEYGWFPNDKLKFHKRHIVPTQLVFTFQPGGKIQFQNLHLGDCPVGEFAMLDGCWKLEENQLILELRSAYFGYHFCWWKVKYKITLHTTNHLYLEPLEIMKNSELNSNQTWEDLECN